VSPATNRRTTPRLPGTEASTVRRVWFPAAARISERNTGAR
jgi:hypothetical protein